MKILQLNDEKGWHAGERQTLLLAAALQAKGVFSTIACRQQPLAQQAREAQVPTLPLSGNPVGGALDLIRFTRGCDLVHCHTSQLHSLATATAFRHRKPIVATRRVDFPPHPSRFNRFKYRATAKIVCTSEFIAAQLRDWGVPPEKLAVIRPAVELPPPCPAELVAVLRGELHVPENRRLVGNIGALLGHKDHATLLRAARLIADQRNDVMFVVIGDGALRADLRRLRRELHLEEVVLFPGYLPQAVRFFPAFDVFAVSSCVEGTGSTLLEACAAGTPVAATAASEIPNLVRDGETGLLAPVGDAPALAAAIARLLDETPLARRLGAAARHWAETECSVARMTDRYLQVYREVLGGTAAPGSDG